MNLLEAQEWIKEFHAFMSHNKPSLEHHNASVPQQLLEVNIDAALKLKLTADAKPETKVEECQIW